MRNSDRPFFFDLNPAAPARGFRHLKLFPSTPQTDEAVSGLQGGDKVFFFYRLVSHVGAFSSMMLAPSINRL
jgi:hypothetical protein